MKPEDAIKRVLPFFSKAYVYKEEEIILEPKNNIYFRIVDVRNGLEFDCKMLEWLSRPSCKGLSNYWQSYMLRGLNSYFVQAWSKVDMELIYTKLGNGVNRKLCMAFILKGLDLSMLKGDDTK